MTFKKILKGIRTSICNLKSEERCLSSKASERAFAHRLAVHLGDFFNEWDVDCEYNLQGLDKKMLIGISDCDMQRATDRIFPDIIIHKRGKSLADSNLLVIELKKNNKEDQCDKIKLKLLTSLSGFHKYKYGLYINITYKTMFIGTWYENGEVITDINFSY